MLNNYEQLLKPRVKALQGITQVVAVEMGINFGGGNAFMSKHFLHSP